MTTVKFIFQSYLKEMLKKKHVAGPGFFHHFERHASVKDVVESLGVPHPIIGKLTVNCRESGFDYILRHNDIVEVSPLVSPVDPLVPSILRPEALDRIAFVADVNVGKLALLLRMLGFDTTYGRDLRDRELARIAYSEKRILLTRDTSLLKRKIISHGYLIRAQKPASQIVETVRLYDLSSSIKPLSRCIPCNGRLAPVSKKNILARLEPLTRKYYDSFHICKQCGKLYWPGSHQEKIVSFIRQVLEEVKGGN